MGSSAGEEGAGSEALPASSGRVNAASLVTLVAPHRDPGLGGWVTVWLWRSARVTFSCLGRHRAFLMKPGLALR